MEVILLEEVDKLGYKDDVVNVKPGYARNYLIPQQKAIVANPSNRKSLEEKLKQQKLKHEKLMDAYNKQAETLKDKKIKIGAKVGASDKIFGSVTALQLADSIKNQTGVEVDRKKIKMPDDIKTLGTYTAEVELHKDIKAPVEFEVVSE